MPDTMYLDTSGMFVQLYKVVSRSGFDLSLPPMVDYVIASSLSEAVDVAEALICEDGASEITSIEPLGSPYISRRSHREIVKVDVEGEE